MAAAGVTQEPLFYGVSPSVPGDAGGNVSYVTLTQCVNQTSNCTTGHADDGGGASQTLLFEFVVRIVVPIIFTLISVLGFTGNMLVIIVVLANRQMRNTTNLLILSLSVADLFFIIICVPFTAMSYAMTTFPFGIVWCRTYQYVVQVTAYVSIYTLVLMSLDRYLAVVHPISSMTLRTERNTVVVIVLCWIVILLGNIPVMLQHGVIEYDFNGEARSACINLNHFRDKNAARIFYGCFFVFAYVLPLALIVVLYGTMLKRLLHGVVPRGNQSSESNRSRRRVTRLVVIVVVIFALCWLPIQVIFMIKEFGTFPQSYVFMAIQIASNCLAYMNSCVNPILYAFLSDNFRKSFRKLLTFGRFRGNRLEYERTTTRVLDPTTRATHMNNNENCV